MHKSLKEAPLDKVALELIYLEKVSVAKRCIHLSEDCYDGFCVGVG